MTTRQEKVSSLVARELGAYILRQDFEGMRGLLTITKAEVTADLEQVKIYFSVLNQDAPEVKNILQKNIYEMQGWLNSRLKMRKTPRITFVIDDSGKYASKIEKLIRDLPR